MKTFLCISLFVVSAFINAQDSSFCYNSGLSSSNTEEQPTTIADNKQSNSLILMPYVMKEKEVILFLKEKKNPSINRLLTKLKLSNSLQPIGFAAIPAGIIGAWNMADSNNRPAQQSIGMGFMALGAVCLSSGIYFNIERKKNYKKVIKEYNQLYN